ncbi:MAG: PP2C family protein-serine/threonine phosphatase [Opitutaceae bacterium]
MRLRHACLSDRGQVRMRNEDRCLCDERLGVYGVADGVGGLPGGDEAAQIAHDCILHEIGKVPPGTAPDLRRIVESANRAVEARGRAVNPGEGIATTLTFGVFRGRSLNLAHVGDSRCYLARNGAFRRLTADHAEGRALSRCLGHPISSAPDLAELPVWPGDRYLFCTDGLTRSASDEEIAAIVEQPVPAERILRELTDLSLRRGGLDNVSAVLVYPETGSLAPR